jgi:hypothetical protein
VTACKRGPGALVNFTRTPARELGQCRVAINAAAPRQNRLAKGMLIGAELLAKFAAASDGAVSASTELTQRVLSAWGARSEATPWPMPRRPVS